MILTDYYGFEHLPDCKSALRLDCEASTQNYNEFERMRNKRGELFIYFCNVPDSFKVDVRRQADKIITSREGKNVSSVFVPDVTLPFGLGDVKGTADAILIIGNDNFSSMEIFIARGQKNNRINLWQMLCGGELDEEMAELRTKAVTESVTKNSK